MKRERKKERKEWKERPKGIKKEKTKRKQNNNNSSNNLPPPLPNLEATCTLNFEFPNLAL